jgi:outer membrane protein
MRKSLTAGVFGGFLFVALSGAILLPQDNPLKIGFIDSQAVLGAYPGTTEAQATFNAENDAWRRQATSMEQEVTRMTQELERQSMAMSQERRAQLQADLQARGLEYQNFINEVWGQTGRAFQRNQELMQPIVDKLNGLLETVGRDEGFDFVLDAATAAIVYADPSYDLTPKFIELMGTGDNDSPR